VWHGRRSVRALDLLRGEYGFEPRPRQLYCVGTISKFLHTIALQYYCICAAEACK